MNYLHQSTGMLWLCYSHVNKAFYNKYNISNQRVQTNFDSQTQKQENKSSQ